MEGTTRRRVTLYDQMTGGHSDTSSTGSSRSSLASLILHKSRNQTLLDIIREDEPEPEPKPNNNNFKDSKSWKVFKDKLRLLNRASASTSTPTTLVHHIPPIQSHADESTRQQLNDVVREDTDNSDPTTLLAGGGDSSDEDNNNNNPATRQVSMSLMDLLEETEVEDLDPTRSEDDNNDDGDGDGDGGVVVDEDQKQEGGEELEQEEEGGEEGGVVPVVGYNCCVCMVRHKGAAFIPCGHTFCRMCSRELWVTRGNCPLCNNFILEILDIF